jgi:nucleoid DNA-binding protein
MAKAKAAKKASAKAKPRTKSELFSSLAEATGLSKKDVVAVFEALAGEIKKDLGAGGPGVFALPGLCKLTRVVKPATEARKGVMVLGQLRDIPAKPASTKVKVLALKGLKEMV